MNADNNLKYEWFVWAAEEILEYKKKDKTWRRNLQLIANKHREYFTNNKEFQEIEIHGYSPSVKDLVKRVIQQEDCSAGRAAGRKAVSAKSV